MNAKGSANGAAGGSGNPRNSSGGPPGKRVGPHADDSFTDLEKLDRDELDESEDAWSDSSEVRRLKKANKPPPKTESRSA